MLRRGFRNSISSGKEYNSIDMEHGRKSRKKKRWAFLVLLAVLFVIFVTAWTLVNADQRTKTEPPQIQKVKGNWIGSWAASMQAPSDEGISDEGIKNQTVRFIVHPHLDGSKLRIRLSNEFGTDALTLDEVHVAVAKDGAKIDRETDHQVTFGKDKSVTIPAGGKTVSDPVSLHVKSGRNLAVSIYVYGETGSLTWHPHSMQTSYLSTPGNHVSDLNDAAFKTTEEAWFWLTGIDVKAKPSVKGAIVVVGSSIANGNHSTLNANHRWTDDLARRLNQKPPDQQMSVLNAGISANRLLEGSPEIGDRAIDRLSRDVFSRAGVKAVILHEGLNDIRHHPDEVDADKLITGMKQIITDTHDQGLKIYGGTLTPFEGSGMYTEEGEKTREAVNHWIRTSGAFDGVIDFDQAVRDPKHPKRFLPKYDHGDHFHPNDAGYQAMADAVDLSMFQ